MFVVKPGSVGPLVELNAALGDIHARKVKAASEARAEHEKNGAPLDEVPEVPGDFKANPNYEGLRLRVRALTQLEAFDLGRDIGADDLRETYVAMRRMVKRSLAELHGLEDDGGPVVLKADEELSDEQLDLLDAAGIVQDLWQVCRVFQDLTGDEKKRFGCPPQ